MWSTALASLEAGSLFHLLSFGDLLFRALFVEGHLLQQPFNFSPILQLLSLLSGIQIWILLPAISLALRDSSAFHCLL